MNYSVLVVAAGKRAGEGVSYRKALASFNESHSVLAQSVSVFLEDERCTQIVVVASAADMKEVVGFSDSGKISYVKGGKTRQDSLLMALTAIIEKTVIVHDGVRPWIRLDHIDGLLERMETERACVLGVPIRSSVYSNEDGYLGKRVETKSLITTQTPQAFKTDLLFQCYRKACHEGIHYTDDASIVMATSDAQIAIVEGDLRNVRFMLKD